MTLDPEITSDGDAHSELPLTLDSGPNEDSGLRRRPRIQVGSQVDSAANATDDGEDGLLTVHGNEAPRPTRTGKPRWLFLLTLMVVVGVAVSVAYGLSSLLQNHAAFRLSDVSIEGATRFSREQILTIAGVLIGEPTARLDRQTIEERLESNPWVAEAHVTIGLPNRLRISVLEEHAAAILLSEDVPLLVNDSGELFKVWEPADQVDVVTISGLNACTMQTCPPHQRQWLRDVISELNAGAILEQMNVRLSEIHRLADGSVSAVITRERTSVTNLSTNERPLDSPAPIEVYLGLLPLGDRWIRLGETLRALSLHHQSAEVIRLDQVQHPNRVVVRLRQS